MQDNTGHKQIMYMILLLGSLGKLTLWLTWCGRCYSRAQVRPRAKGVGRWSRITRPWRLRPLWSACHRLLTSRVREPARIWQHVGMLEKEIVQLLMFMDTKQFQNYLW